MCIIKGEKQHYLLHICHLYRCHLSLQNVILRYLFFYQSCFLNCKGGILRQGCELYVKMSLVGMWAA